MGVPSSLILITFKSSSLVCFTSKDLIREAGLLPGHRTTSWLWMTSSRYLCPLTGQLSSSGTFLVSSHVTEKTPNKASVSYPHYLRGYQVELVSHLPRKYSKEGHSPHGRPLSGSWTCTQPHSATSQSSLKTG